MILGIHFSWKANPPLHSENLPIERAGGPDAAVAASTTTTSTTSTTSTVIWINVLGKHWMEAKDWKILGFRLNMDPRMLNVPFRPLWESSNYGLCDAFRSEVLEVVTPKPVDDTRLPLWRFGVPTVIMWFSKGSRIAWKKGVYIIRYVYIYMI